MGNCASATKPKVLKDSDEVLIPVERDTTVPVPRRSEKGKEILIEDDVEEEQNKRQSLCLLFHEDKAIEKEITNLSRNKSGTSSEASKLDTSVLVASNVKAPETFDVQNRNDLEVKIPKAEDQQVNFSENWEVKFPEELEATKTSEVVKVAEESKLPQDSMVSAPQLSEVKATQEPDVPEVLEDKNVPEDSEVPAPPELSEIKVRKVSNVSEVLEDKNVTEVPNVMTDDEVKAAESELLEISEVTTLEDLEIEVPKVFEVKTPETLSVGPEIKIDQEATKVKTTEETKASEFLDAQEKTDKSKSHILEDTKKL